MKKILFALLITLLISGCKHHTKNDLGIDEDFRSLIKIPSPGNDLTEVDIDKYSFYKDKVMDNKLLTNVFVDATDFKNYQAGKLDSNLFFKVFSVGFNKYNLTHDINQWNFHQYFYVMKADLKQNLKNKFLSINSKDPNFSTNFNDFDLKEMETMKLICDEKPALSILSATYFIENSKIYKVFFTRSYIVVKDKMICLNVMNLNTGVESKAWIIDNTNKWIHAILKAN